MVLQAHDYLVVPKTCEAPKARLVCFPHSGGGPSAFASWPEFFDGKRVEVVAVSAPGRERRADVQPLTDWQIFVNEVCEALLKSGLVDDVPYAFVGHSLGALMAYEVARALDAKLVPGRPQPMHIFASGHGAPATAAVARQDVPEWGIMHTLDNAALLKAVQSFGVIPSALAEDQGLMDLLLPVLRADFQMYETYAPGSGRTPLGMRITALGGSEDTAVPVKHLNTWGAETSCEFREPKVFPGGHFFLDTQRKEVLDFLGAELEISLAALPVSVLKTEIPSPEECSKLLLQEVFLDFAHKQPDAQAVIDDNITLSYHELAGRVELLAQELHKRVLHGRAGQVVALLMPHDAHYLTCMLGIFHAAAILIVIEAHYPPSLCKEICEESKTIAAICSTNHVIKFKDVVGCQTIVLEGDWPVALASGGAPASVPKPALEDISILMMTSGTTGRPKTIAGSHYFMHFGQKAKTQYIPFTEDDNREAFNVMFVWEVCRPLLYGLTSFIIPDEAVLDPQLFVATLQKHRCSRVLTTPSLLATIMQYCAQGLGERLSSMRTWLGCGEVLPMSTVQRFRQLLPGCRLVNDYSTWESADVAYAAVAPAMAYEPSPIFAPAGFLAPGVVVAVIDPDTKQALPQGVAGELYVGGTALSYGYYSQPEVTAAKFVDSFTPEMKNIWQGKWYKTGDAARLIGNPPVLEIRGRIDSTVKIRGFKVGIPVVESAITDTPGVAKCAVIPIYESPGIVDSLLCFLTPDDGYNFEDLVQKVKQEAVQRIPRVMIPTYFKPMPDEAVSGGEARKLDRKKLANMYDLQSLRESQTEAPGAEDANQEAQEVQTGVRGIMRSIWAKALNLNPNTLDLEENFFDIGGHSTLAARIASELSNDYGLPVTVLDIYSHSSLGALIDFVEEKTGASSGSQVTEAKRVPRARGMNIQDGGIAVVGHAGRFPGAVDSSSFFESLRKGTVSATFLSKELLRSKGVPEANIANKDFVPCAYMISDADKFDHAFFGIGRHEASIMDPQHRVFIETTWAAMENAALPPRTGLSDTVVGVFAAAGIDGYLVHHLDGLPLKDSMDPQDIFLAEIGNEKDYIATRVSYLLDFTGPSMNVNSACSSALVAVAQASAAIVSGQCDAAVAGASSITFPNLGYLYQDGLVASVDGYVRPFDAKADGTVFGDSVASLVLRRTDEAGRLVWGTLKGFAVTNDGGQKAGYAAPSPVGQSQAVMNAQQMMGEDPWSVSYVECHCTGTRVGDGIEVRGLLDAFAQTGGKRGANEARVAMGSVKGNIAHANCAAGATGLIKVLGMLQSRQLVPTANFAKLNPKISLDSTPFFINGELCSWDAQDRPLRAGVSSFGIGGTNAHVILDEPREAAVPEPEPTAKWSFHVLPMSARTPAALRKGAECFAANLEQQGPQASLASAAYTLQSGRAALPLRKALVVPTAAELSATGKLVEQEFPDEDELEELEDAVKRPTVAFLFPGQGSQYFRMARGLYEQVPLFRKEADQCCELLAGAELLGFDLRPHLFPSSASAGNEEEEKQREQQFARPTVLQPGLFIVEYALARLFLAVGVVPVATAGHSLGEYAAAVIGGLLTLESAVAIVAARAKSTETLAEDGAMLSVADWTEQELSVISNGERAGLWLAAKNSPAHAVISGEETAINALEAELKAAGKKCAKLHVRKAFHSGLIAKAADTLKGLGLPKADDSTAALPVASNFTGGWMSSMLLRDGTYWASHMRGTVRWRDNAEKLLTQWQPTAVLEVGPGNALSTLTSKCVGANQTAPAFLQGMRHPKATSVHDVEALLGALGRLWETGYNVDWSALHSDVLGQQGPPALLRLPAYAFDRTSLWANPERSAYVDSTPDPAPATYANLGTTGAKKPAAEAVAPGLLLRFGDVRSREPSIKAYCLPFACGSATIFAPWAEQADEAVEVVAVELPGRGGRSDEPVPGDDAQDEALLNSLCDAILQDLRGSQYVLVGFSMGGGLSVDLALRMAARGATLPLAVYVAGRKPPVVDPAAVGAITMSNEELADYAFAPPEVARSPEFAEHVVPLLRKDLELDARNERRLSSASIAGRSLPPGVGLEVFCGTSDGVAPFAEAPGWQRFAQEPMGMHYYPGGHEFMKEQRPLLHTDWRRDAVGRLLGHRSAELALLTGQGLPATVATPMTMSALTSPARPAQQPQQPQLPLHAVRWTAVENQEEVALPASFFIDLGGELSASLLNEAVTAMQGGAVLVAACAAAARTVSSEPLEAEVAQSWRFVQLVQRLLEAGCAGRFVLACPAAVSGAMVAGASKAVAMEAAELRVQRVFVPPAFLVDARGRAPQICALASRHPQEADLWVQDADLRGQAFAPRLEPMSAPSAKLPCVPKRAPDGGLATYVLTGATGGLGSAVVRWLLKDQGLKPEQLVLLRRAGSAPLAGELASCRVVEVASPDNPRALLASSLRELRGVSGILHLAGVLDDGIISGMTEERMRKVAKPKCGMLAALLGAARALRWSPRWALCFSSTSSLLGYAGQANYCAANALLDQLAAFGGAGVLPEGDRPPCRILAINWGPWAEAGMAKAGTKAYEQALQEGDRPLPTATALACLAAALRAGGQAQPAAVQFAVCDVEWERSQWNGLPALEILGHGPSSAAAAGGAGASASPSAAAEPPERRAEDFLLQNSKGGSSWKRVQGKSLHQLGLDSLEIVQVRNAFNKKFGSNVPLSVLADPSRKLSDLASELSKHIAA